MQSLIVALLWTVQVLSPVYQGNPVRCDENACWTAPSDGEPICAYSEKLDRVVCEAYMWEYR